MKKPHFSITEAGLIAAATTAVGQVIAFVPAWAPYQAKLVSLASIIISAAWVFANSAIHLAHVMADAYHEIASAHVNAAQIETQASMSLPELESHVEKYVQNKVDSVDLNQLVKDNLNAQGIQHAEDFVKKGELEQAVESRVAAFFQKLVGGGATGPVTSETQVAAPTPPGAGPEPAQS